MDQNFDKVRNLYHDFYHKYIKIKPDILAEVNNFFETHLAGNICVGVHKRHVLHYREEFSKTAVSVGDYIEVIKKLISQSGGEKIFLATDEEEAVEEMKKAFGDRLICRQDITRASVSESQEMHWQAQNSGSRLGREVLIDALLLAKCDIMLHGVSNISTAISFINPDLKLVYLYAGQDGNCQIFSNQKNINFKPELISEDRKILEVKTSNNLTGRQRDLQEEKNQRQQLAQQWLNTPTEQLAAAYAGKMGQYHQTLLHKKVNQQPLTETEQFLVKEWIHSRLNSSNNLQALLAVMLYRKPHQLPVGWYHNLVIPEWLQEDYLKFMLTPPSLFTTVGEADLYSQYLQAWVEDLHQQLLTHPNDKQLQKAGLFFTQQANLLCIYFTNNANLRSLYQQRAEIIQFTLSRLGHRLDDTIPERPVNLSKIRLGILCDHFTPQTETFATLPVFEYLDREQFEVILYTFKVNEHPLEEYCRSRVAHLTQLPQDLIGAVETIRSDDLDLLWIGTNLTALGRPSTLMAAHRLARVQLTSICSPVTTGMSTLDYYVAGHLTAPLPDFQDQYQETLITVEGSGLCFSFPLPQKALTQEWTRSMWGVDTDTVVFISGANFYKIIPELQQTWAKILAAVSNSVLVLYPFNPNWSNSYPRAEFEQQMHQVFTQFGVNTNRFVIMSPLPSSADVLACLQLADVYLDSYPYSGATSLLDPLKIGLPVVVLEGDALRFRQGSALLRELQVFDLIAENEAAYINLAVKLATQPEWRQQKREEIQQKMENPPFLDSRAYSQQIGTLLQEVWQD